MNSLVKIAMVKSSKIIGTNILTSPSVAGYVPFQRIILTHYNSNQIILGVDMLSNSVDLPELIENKAKDLIIYVFCIDESWNLFLMFINTSIKFYSTCSKRVVSKILQRNFFVESS